MKLSPLLACALLAFACRSAPSQPDYERPLRVGAPALLPLGPNETPPDLSGAWVDRDRLVPALVRSLDWTRTRYSEQFFPMAGISHARALASLERFHELLLTSPSPGAFNSAVRKEFDVYRSAGWDGRGGGVLFTGYCTPILSGRLEPVADYRFPLYALPSDLEKGPDGAILGRRTAKGLEPYPTRRVIEASGMLAGRGLELVWLRDPIDAFLAHVNGSAFIELENGSMYRLGYSGKNGQPYTSLGGELVADGQLAKGEVNLPTIRRWASQHPELVDEYLGRNESYVFFTPIEGNPRGSLNVEVTAETTLATDKRLFPRGALVFVETSLPSTRGMRRFSKLMLDQDTGGAIRTAGRADIYLGIGPEAERLAGATRAEGQMYYLFLKPALVP